MQRHSPPFYFATFIMLGPTQTDCSSHILQAGFPTTENSNPTSTHSRGKEDISESVGRDGRISREMNNNYQLL